MYIITDHVGLLVMPNRYTEYQIKTNKPERK